MNMNCDRGYRMKAYINSRDESSFIGNLNGSFKEAFAAVGVNGSSGRNNRRRIKAATHSYHHHH